MNKIEIYTTQRGQQAIIIGGYKFRIKKKQKSSLYWTCRENTCKARCTTTTDMTEILVQSSLEHNHEPETKEKRKKDELRESCKKRALDEPDLPPSKVFIKEIEKRGSNDLLPKEYVAIREAMYRKRSSIQSKLPSTQQEVFDSIQDGRFQPKDTTIVAVHENSIVFVAFEESLQLVEKTERFFGDGTFKFSPAHFYQFYTIHGEILGHFIPLFFCILPSKTLAMYLKMIDCIIEQCSRRNIVFNPSTIHLDFEISVHQAFQTRFPGIQIKACIFHLKQSWLRKCQELGLKKEYEQRDTEISNWLRLLFGLCCLPPSEVEDFFCFNIVAVAPRNDSIESLLDYILKTYILPSGQFPPQLWASQEVSSRTTNCCESFHFHFGQHFRSPSPNIFTFIRQLENFHILTKLKINAAQSNHRAEPKKSEKDKRQHWEETVEKYNSGNIDQTTYVKRMSFKFF